MTRENVLNFHDQEYIKQMIAIAEIADVDFYELFLLNISFMFVVPHSNP